jgi:hypothetical protein
MPLEVALATYFLIPYLQPFQNGGLQTYEADAKLEPVNMGP